MPSHELDCRGQACPHPVLNTKELVDQGEVSQLIVLVDNDAARENVSRFLERSGYEVRVAAREGAFAVTGTRGEERVPKPPASSWEEAAPRKNLVLVGADRIGTGDDVLGQKETLDFLTNAGVPTVGLNALIYSGRGKHVGTGLKEEELLPLLEIAHQKTEEHNQRLIWYTPTQYCHFDPVQLELGVKGCTAALFIMCIEPDGSVIPCQSYYRPLGNLLNDPWDSIWNNDLAISLVSGRICQPSVMVVPY